MRSLLSTASAAPGDAAQTSTNPQSRNEVMRHKNAYERGRLEGFDIAMKEAVQQRDVDLWMFGGLGVLVLSLCGWYSSRRSQVTLRQAEHIRDEAATLLALKEKELSLEQVQVRQLQAMHKDYLERVAKQRTLIARLRSRHTALRKRVNAQNIIIHRVLKNTATARSAAATNHSKITELRSTRQLLLCEIRQLGHTFGGVLLCSTMWISYHLGYKLG